MKKIKYTKPTGVELEVNDTEDNRAYAKKNGWKETNRIKKPAVKEQIEINEP